MNEQLLGLLHTVRSTGIGVQGGVTGGVATSLRRTMLLGMLAWTGLSTAVALVASSRLSPAALVLAHLALLGCILASLRGRFPFELSLALAYAVAVLDFVAARSVDDALTLATCWLSDLLYVVAALALTTRARTWLPLVGAIPLAVVPAAVSPVWDLRTTSAFVVTAIAIVVAARLAMPSLWKLASEADENIARLEHELGAQEIARRTSADSAEDARLIHDTVINTLAAVANGGHGVRQPGAVRERCRRDLAVVEGMLRGRRNHGRRSLADLTHEDGTIRVRRSGLADADLDELESLLAPRTTEALVGAATEAIRNAAKHAGVAVVDLDAVRTDDRLVLSVTDEGVGFGPGTSPGTGVTRSIRDRVRAVGGDALVESAAGRGTRVTISVPLQVAEEDGLDTDLATDVHEITERLNRRACWLGSTGILGVGVFIEATNRPGALTWTYAMLALVAGGTGLAYLAVRNRAALPWPVAIVLVLALPAAFTAALAGVDFGRTEVLYVQAIGFAPLLIIMLSTGAPRWTALAGAGLAATAAVIAVVMWQDSATYGAVVVVAVMPSLGLALGWRSFQQLVVRIVTESERARRLAFEASLAAGTAREIAEARSRWGTASLERSAALLRGIADGELDVSDDQVRGACAHEEEYLRQLLLLSPSAYRMSAWFAHALAAARSRGVRLLIRSGDQDAPDAAAAQLMGRLLLEVVAAAPEDADLHVGWFPTSAGPRLLVIGPAAGPARAVPDLSTFPSSWQFSRTVLEQQELLEVVVA